MNIIVKWVQTQWDRVFAWVLVIAGGLAIVLGWNGVSQEPLTAQQIPYVISGGVGGLFLLGVGAMLWLSADLRDEWRRLDAIERNGRRASTLETVEDDPFLAADGAGLHGTSGDSAEPVAPDVEAPTPGKRARRKPLTAR